MISDGKFWFLILVSVPLFWLMRPRLRMPFLAVASFLYLLVLEPLGILVLLGYSVAFYAAGVVFRDRGKYSTLLMVLILVAFGYLAYFKYVPRIVSAFAGEPAMQHVMVPLGVSYFTFKLVHYAIEVRRGNFQRHGIWDFFSYIFLFPIFTAGPIERFEHYLANIDRRWSREFFVDGVTRICHGLVKKFVIAEMLILPLYGDIGDGATLLGALDQLPPHRVWAFCIVSFAYLYLDFSAYSDIAIGISRLYGIRIMENFNWPILASNISIFWRRWHMTLASWCQHYVYLPVIGLTRNPYVATYLTFCAIGLWHSGSLGWLGWGLYHATGISVFGYWNRYRRRRKWRGLDRPGFRWLGTVVTMMFVCAGSTLTALDGVGDAYDILRVYAKLFGATLPS